MATAESRSTLSGLVRDTLTRSHAKGASRLLAEVALQDIDEARAARAVQASVGGVVGPGGSRTANVTENAAPQLRATLNISQLLYDGGRSDRMVDWRTQLAESARYGHRPQQEQLALTAVALQQADLTLSQTQSTVRQIEVRLRRLIGDGLPPTDGLSTVFNGLPDLPQLVADAERSSEIAQLDAQAAAARRYAEAVAASGAASKRAGDGARAWPHESGTGSRAAGAWRRAVRSVCRPAT